MDFSIKPALVLHVLHWSKKERKKERIKETIFFSMEFYIKPALVLHALHFIFYRKKLVRISLHNFFYEGILCKMNPEKFKRNSFLKEINKVRKKERKKDKK